MTKKMTKKQIEAEAAFADEAYRNRAALEHRAREVLSSGSRQITIRMNNGEIELAKRQAKVKGLRYQTYMKMLLHQALIADR